MGIALSASQENIPPIIISTGGPSNISPYNSSNDLHSLPSSQTESSPQLESNEVPQEASSPSLHSTNISSDGFKWRKYGKKQLKGTIHPRHYYKCTFPGCQVKKSVEIIEEDGKPGQKISYKGEHTHDTSRMALLISNHTINSSSSSSSRQNINEIQTTTSNNEESSIKTSKRVEETNTTIDDGYHWRKYGQKSVKSSNSKRSYYKCTELNCNAKKQVEKKESGVKTSYEGTHNHSKPSTSEPRKKRKQNSEVKIESSNSIQF